MTTSAPAPSTLRLESRHTGERLEFRRRTIDGEPIFELRGRLPPHRAEPGAVHRAT